MRFNRKAQCIHIFVDRKTVLTFPWRSVIPFTAIGQSSSGRYNLIFLCPILEGSEFYEKGVFNIMEVPGAFDSGDYVSMRNNTDRLEFIRRYMETGLENIQPSQEMIDAGLVNKPSGFAEKVTVKKYGILFKLCSLVLDNMFYILGAGWLVDRWVKKRARSYVWPEEIEKLCSADADLSNLKDTFSELDSSPVTPQDKIFYGYKNGDFTYFDKDGNELE